ncbi:MAG: D-alanyl-D-alanine carboxypeptidase/D-alanyl-D-alanine-endopeptidase [Actinomycetota bacterium]
MGRATVAVVSASSIAAIAAAASVVYAVAGNPFAEPPPAPTLAPMPTSTPTPASTVLAASGELAARPDGALVEALEAPLDSGALGGRTGVAVADLSTGEMLYERDAATPMTPASTLKLLTAVAALEVLGPDEQFRTRVVSGAEPDEIVLVGGGDPMLTTDEPRMSRPTMLGDLADSTAAALAEQDVSTVRLAVDDSLFSGPAVNPAWEPGYVPSGVVAPVSALAVDGGRETPGLRERSPDPALAAGAAFAEMLEDRDIAVEGEPSRATAAPDARELAVVASAPLVDVVEHVIATSDNDVSEVLLRHVALGLGRPGSTEEATAAVGEVLDGLGVDSSDATVVDGSGLARGSAVPPGTLVEVLVLAASPDHAELRPVLTGLPVAAWNGTLDDRIGGAPGLVRAKTGTLTGVHTLSGIAKSGESGLAFAVLANDAPNALAAQAALDDMAEALAHCACHGASAEPSGEPSAEIGMPD